MVKFIFGRGLTEEDEFFGRKDFSASCWATLAGGSPWFPGGLTRPRF